MAIPKEPRQLMINIMYLVLTALLALNVSAEVFNAFKIVDKGLKNSNAALTESNAALPELIKDGAKKKKSLQVYADRIDPVRNSSKSLYNKIEALKQKMIDETGGYIDAYGVKELKGKKDNGVTTRILVDEGEGERLKAELQGFTRDLLKLVDEGDQSKMTSTLPTIVDDKTWEGKKKNNKNYTWSTFNFNQMPLQAVLPILTKFQNDIKSSEAEILNYLAGKVGTTTDVVLDKFTVVSAPEKTYVIKGERFKTDVFLSASASADANTGVKISVNGKPLSVNADGVAEFTMGANSVGKKNYNVEASITNPVTGEVQSFKKSYEFEVGERSATISASKMNVFYIGVDNPVEVSVAGVPSNQVKVNMAGPGGGTISPKGDGTFNVKVTKPTKAGEYAKVNVSGGGFTASKDFRVKRIPDPYPHLSKKRGGVMSPGEFKAQGGVGLEIPGFDFDARCNLAGFRVVRVPRRADPEVANNPGTKYNGDTGRVVGKAKPGDRYFFENIKCKCPGDPAARDLGTMTFTIK